MVKAKIREYSLHGNHDVLRKGSPHFLPNTEVVLCHFYNSQYRFHNKLWVRGKHKSGLLKTKGTYFKYLTELRLEEIRSPSNKTLNFIKKNGILTIEEGDSGNRFQDVKNLIEFFEEIQEPEILSGEIEDKLFLNSKKYIQHLQSLLKRKDFDEILENHLKFPIKIKKRKEFKSLIADKNEFLTNYKSIFFEKISDSIIKTDLETIFPSKDRMIIGLCEIEINREENFKISKIEIE